MSNPTPARALKAANLDPNSAETVHIALKGGAILMARAEARKLAATPPANTPKPEKSR
ncbi:hypothetical protein [Mameliella sp.]|uniref:hypothetical protein n=1 Tax=Mameliella sp. TaxID=1924940 RepID=UPI003B514618